MVYLLNIIIQVQVYIILLWQMKSYTLRFENTQREIELIMKENFSVEWKMTEKYCKWLAIWVKGSELSSEKNLLTTIDSPRTPWLAFWSTLVCLLLEGTYTPKPLLVLILVGTHMKFIQGAEDTEKCAFYCSRKIKI